MKLIILLFLTIMAYQDYKDGQVSNWLYLPLFPFLNFKLVIVLIFIVVVIGYNKFSKYLGGADIKIFFIFALIFDFEMVLVWLLFSLIFALIYAKTLSKREIRMFPFFLIGYLGVLLWV